MISSRWREAAVLIWVSGLLFTDGAALAQGTAGGNYGNNGGSNGSLSREEIEKLGGAAAQSGTPAERATSPAAQAKVRLQSEKVAKALQLSCQISSARLVVAGRSKAKGKEVESTVYEVACSNGAGYLIEVQGQDKPLGISCLAAEGARAADAAQGKETKFICSLPQNKDVKAMVGALMKGAGTTCDVRDIRWFGRSEATESEYTEAVCDDGRGFLLRSPSPGSATPIQVVGCAEAARQGLECRLTDSGSAEALPTLDAFKMALARNGVTCNIDRIRQVGQEQVRKRYVVEYACAGQSSGRVAFIPLEGNSYAYEAVDCAAAVLKGVACQFLPPPQ
jgi:hypothetical protein